MTDDQGEKTPQRNGGLRPVPDPTVLTTNLVDRAIEGERDRTTAQMAVRDERLRAVEAMTVERFTALNQRTAEQKSDTTAAVAAALAAAKEAVTMQTAAADKAIAKTEAAFDKRIDAQGVLLQTTTASTDEKISDLKVRMERFEAIAIGRIEQNETTRGSNSDNRAVIGAIIGAVLAAIAIIGFFSRDPSQTGSMRAPSHSEEVWQGSEAT